MCGILACVTGCAADVDFRDAPDLGRPPHPSDDDGDDDDEGRERAGPRPPVAHADADGWADWLDARGPDGRREAVRLCEGCRIEVASSLLQTRGVRRIEEGFRDDGAGDMFAFNGEIYAGIDGLADDANDGVALEHALRTCESVPHTMSRLRGPWALVFWCARTRTLWFGRDALGRRSLLLVDGPGDDGRPFLCLSSVAHARFRELRGCTYREVPPGLYAVNLREGKPVVRRTPWEDPIPRSLAGGGAEDSTNAPDHDAPSFDEAAGALLDHLRASVRARCLLVHQLGRPPRLVHAQKFSRENEKHAGESIAPASVAVLFSGGLDSALLARLAAEAMADAPLDLVNVCFAAGTSPDRIAAREAIEELARALPRVPAWRLIEIDASLDDVDACRPRLVHLLHPANTYMDLNIGAALHIGASCRGRLRIYSGGLWHAPLTPTESEDGGEGEGEGKGKGEGTSAPPPLPQEPAYCSRARVILMGQGADEQCGGYGRHRTVFKAGGFEALRVEIAADVRRLWLRNLGRDDRCVGARGREARFPFLDEAVVAAISQLPVVSSNPRGNRAPVRSDLESQLTRRTHARTHASCATAPPPSTSRRIPACHLAAGTSACCVRLRRAWACTRPPGGPSVRSNSAHASPS